MFIWILGLCFVFASSLDTRSCVWVKYNFADLELYHIYWILGLVSWEGQLQLHIGYKVLFLVFASPRRLSIKDMNMIVFVILDISSCVYFLTHAALTHWILGLVHMFLIHYLSPPLYLTIRFSMLKSDIRSCKHITMLTHPPILHITSQGLACLSSNYWILGLVHMFLIPYPFPHPFFI